MPAHATRAVAMSRPIRLADVLVRDPTPCRWRQTRAAAHPRNRRHARSSDRVGTTDPLTPQPKPPMGTAQRYDVPVGTAAAVVATHALHVSSQAADEGISLGERIECSLDDRRVPPGEASPKVHFKRSQIEVERQSEIDLEACERQAGRHRTWRCIASATGGAMAAGPMRRLGSRAAAARPAVRLGDGSSTRASSSKGVNTVNRPFTPPAAEPRPQRSLNRTTIVGIRCCVGRV
jgi:hypothetical protein